MPIWSVDAGASTPLLTDSALPFANGGELTRWADSDARECLLDAIRPDGAGAPRNPGSLYEEILEHRIRRLDSESVCLKPRRVWISVRDVLSEPPKTRAQWLAARASLPKSAAFSLAPTLADATSGASVLAALSEWLAPGTEPSPAGSLVVESGVARRRSGSHFTPDALCRLVVERALGPLLPPNAGADAVLRLRVCDPSMGSGAFLCEAAEFLASRLGAAWRREGGLDPSESDETVRGDALRAVITTCIYGVDKDPVAVDLARCTLARRATQSGAALPDLSKKLVCGDALVGNTVGREGLEQTALAFAVQHSSRFDWWRVFPEVFGAGEAGFDACIGNPPWVAYAGRAAQPLDAALARYYLETNPAFGGYRTLHGLFVRRAVELLRPGGRLGFVLPTSVADLAGYRATRRAHDALAEVDTELHDFGDGAFEGVFQPCMALTSTRRPQTIDNPPNVEWSLARSDLDAVATRLLEKLSSYPKLDPLLFGERGFQSTGRDVAHLRRAARPEPPFVEPIREGIDIGEFQASPPRCFLNPVGLTGRFRPRSDWNDVRVLIRQTARCPIAALADGVAFRNSILAGFSNEEWTAAALAAYLNSSAVRYYHFVRHRDARQGMPQLKIGHLRALPAIRGAEARAALDAIGRRAGGRNSGITAEERAELERVVFDALNLFPEERALVTRWAAENPLPKRRGAPRYEGISGEESRFDRG